MKNAIKEWSDLSKIKIWQLTLNELREQHLEGTTDHIIFIIKRKSNLSFIDIKDIKATAAELFSDSNLSEIIFISRRDKYLAGELLSGISSVYTKGEKTGLTIFTPYMEAPEFDSREDGRANSFMISADHCSAKEIVAGIGIFWKLLYNLVFKYINSPGSENLKVIQIGKNTKKPDTGTQNGGKREFKKMLDRSLMIIPHKGNPELFYRCLHHLKNIEVPGSIKICFDDRTYKKLEKENFDHIKSAISLTYNQPLNCGPYPGRHYSATETDKDYIFFQDSDDISMTSRFSRQLEELQERGLDMIGSHEIRIDQFKKHITLIRFPLDVNKAFSNRAFHPMFHPTALIKKSAYLKTGGFSTNLKFGYDLQLTMRANFLIKIGNVDDFLYIRFKRPGSLTTARKTKIGTSLRSFLWWRWRVEMRLVSENKLNIKDSSLWVQSHEFDFKMIEFLL